MTIHLHSPEDGANYRLYLIQGFLFLDCIDPETCVIERAIGMPLSHEKAKEIRGMMDRYLAVLPNEMEAEYAL